MVRRIDSILRRRPISRWALTLMASVLVLLAMTYAFAAASSPHVQESMSSGSHANTGPVVPVAWLPLVNGPIPPTPTPTSTPTSTSTPTPTPTPTVEVIRFAGTTNQGEDIDFDVALDFSGVIRFKIAYQLSCPGVSQTGWTEMTKSAGWPITDRRFEIRSSHFGKDDVFTGEFDLTFSSAQGDWEKWLILYYPVPGPVCSNSGTWTASRVP